MSLPNIVQNIQKKKNSKNSNFRMSMFFFRLHNLRREEEIKKRRKRGMRHRHQLTLAPSRLFEKPPLTPSDSLDAVALQIPR